MTARRPRRTEPEQRMQVDVKHAFQALYPCHRMVACAGKQPKMLLMSLIDGSVPLTGGVVNDVFAIGLTGGIHKANNDFTSERMRNPFNKTDSCTSHALPRFKATQIRLINTRLRRQLRLREFG